MRIQIWVGQTVHTAVRDVATPTQSKQEKVSLKLSESVRIASSVIEHACERPAFEVCVSTEDVCGSDELMVQTGSPARVVEVTNEEY